MIIDNFTKVKKMLSFSEGTFYKFEALIRSKDGVNSITKELPSSKKNLLLRTWYIENEEDLKLRTTEMKEFCRATGARLYMAIDKKVTKKALNLMMTKMMDYVLTGAQIKAKTIVNTYNSVTSLKETSSTAKNVLFDIDTKDKRALEAVVNVLNFYQMKFHVLDSLNGYHVISRKRFPVDDTLYEKLYILSNLSQKEVETVIDVKPNALCLVYFDSNLYDN